MYKLLRYSGGVGLTGTDVNANAGFEGWGLSAHPNDAFVALRLYSWKMTLNTNEAAISFAAPAFVWVNNAGAYVDMIDGDSCALPIGAATNVFGRDYPEGRVVFPPYIPSAGTISYLGFVNRTGNALNSTWSAEVVYGLDLDYRFMPSPVPSQ